MHSAKTEGSKKGTVIEMSEQKKVTNVGKQKQMGMIITILVLVLLVVVVVIAMILGGGSSGNPSVTTNDVTPPLVTGNGGVTNPPINANGADIVNFAVDSALKLKRPDGGFSSNLDRAQFTQQGFLYGLGLTDESDVDGTVIAGHRLRATINGTFGVTVSKDYDAGLGEEFWERCKNKPKIVKTKRLEDYPDMLKYKK